MRGHGVQARFHICSSGKPSPVSTMTQEPAVLWHMLTLADRRNHTDATPHRRNHEVCAVGLLETHEFFVPHELVLVPFAALEGLSGASRVQQQAPTLPPQKQSERIDESMPPPLPLNAVATWN